jgi:IS5 family transposase
VDAEARQGETSGRGRPDKAEGRDRHPGVRLQEPRLDRAHGFVRRFTVTDAASYDGGQLTRRLDKDNTASTVWADTAYRSKRNERHLARSGFLSKVHFRRRPGFDLTPSQAKANAVRSNVRSAIETVFAAQKHRFGLFVRTIGLARATVKIGLANLTYNMRRLIWIEQRKALA